MGSFHVTYERGLLDFLNWKGSVVLSKNCASVSMHLDQNKSFTRKNFNSSIHNRYAKTLWLTC